ncbi:MULTISPECIES: adhesin [unclassified Lysobacter]
MINLRKTAIAMAVAALVTSPLAFAQTVDDPNISADILHNHVVVEDWDITVDDTRNTTVNNDTTNSTTDNTNVNNYTTNTQSDSYSSDVSINDDRSYSTSVSDSYTSDYTSDVSINDDRDYSWNSDVTENIERNEVVNSDIRKEGNEHQVAVSLKKDLSLSSDIAITGAPTVSGDIVIDSAAIAVVDNRQSSSDNEGFNDMLTNDASIEDDVGSEASGNLAFNVAAGDNNVQDNAAALSAADASFAFGMADAEVFVNQAGSGNLTTNVGVINDAGIGGNAFNAASGNIGVNVTSGNNNQQKNALAASVATSAYAQSSVSSNQNSSGNLTDNIGHYESRSETVDIDITGFVDGFTVAEGSGSYEGSASGEYAGTGNAYQAHNFYPDDWDEGPHPGGNDSGHTDFDGEAQGAVNNPYRDVDDAGTEIGGFAFDTDEAGTYEGSESGELGYSEMGIAILDATLSGSVTNWYDIAVNATNTASLSGSAFSAASGNIGVNVSAGTGNMQANSLAMAVAQPSTGGGGEIPPVE